CRRLAVLPTDQANARSIRGGNAGRANVCRSVTPAATTSTAAEAANSGTTALPERAPPASRITIAPSHETRPPTNRHQLASAVGAPCVLNRRYVKAVPSSGPATGTETD